MKVSSASTSVLRGKVFVLSGRMAERDLSSVYLRLLHLLQAFGDTVRVLEKKIGGVDEDMAARPRLVRLRP